MIFISDLQKETLLLVDDMINNKIEHVKILDELLKNGYEFIVETRNGYTSKTRLSLYKRNKEHKLENSFVDLIKRRNGLAYWETIKLS